MKDQTWKTLVIRKCNTSLSEELRNVNSTEETEELYVNQPWAIGFFVWNFRSEEERLACFAEVVELRNLNVDKNVQLICCGCTDFNKFHEP